MKVALKINLSNQPENKVKKFKEVLSKKDTLTEDELIEIFGTDPFEEIDNIIFDKELPEESKNELLKAYGAEKIDLGD